MNVLLERIESLVLNNRWLVILLLVTFLIRLPSLFEPLWYGDEAIYLTIGQKILRGGLLYVDIFDHKTPGIYYLAAASIQAFGASIWGFRVLLMFWVLLTLVVFFVLSKRLFDKKTALMATIFLAAFTATPLLEGNITNSEILMILPTALGIIFGLKNRYFLSGIFFSAAVLLKFPAVFDFAAFFIFVALKDP
jgi:4-amino-4-deoxy-L-arabinose transferase-like glycosyltransferase